MRKVVHLIGEDTPADLLEQMRLLARDGEAVVSIGHPPPGCRKKEARIVHAPFGNPGLAAMRLPEFVRSAGLLHAWGGGDSADLCGCDGRRLALSLSFAPDHRTVDALVARMRAGELALTVPTEAGRQKFLAAGAPATRIFVLPPAAPRAERNGEARQRIRRELGVRDDHVLLVAPGELTRYSGHKFAPWAHAILRQVRPDLRLLIPGRGPAAGPVRFYVGTTGLSEDVLLADGRYASAESLAAADLAVFFHERDCGSADAAFAMAAGLPVVASRTPDLMEILGHGSAESAVFVAPDQPREQAAGVLRLLDDSGLASRLSAAGRRRAEEIFAPARCRAILDQIYGCLASGVRGPERCVVT
jgi:glycosyltransferase involved in cell wall biosynthesis